MDYKAMRDDLLRRKTLYVDPSFPTTSAALTKDYQSSSSVRWRRPGQIISSPKFIVDGATRFDLEQGEVGDCWFVAAAACLAVQSSPIFDQCVPKDQEFDSTYAGIFHFHFWQFGRWVEVVIDDQLPTVNGKLLYAHNQEQPNEFWAALLEKAYAKIYGCSYDNIDGGLVNDALVDFTGGISEVIDLKKKRSSPGNLFDVLYKTMSMSSMMGCGIPDTNPREHQRSNGLYTGHAYSITNLVKLAAKTITTKLIRLRNPWGKGEWSGDWSDRSDKWSTVPDKVKQDLGLLSREDGEFWMSFEDWLANFDILTMCHLDAGAMDDLEEKTTWEVVQHESQWIRGFSAGGCGNPPYEDLFWRNPQFSVTLRPVQSTPGNTGDKGHIIVSVLQQNKLRSDNKPISFMLYQLKAGVPVLLDGKNYDKSALLLAKTAAPFEYLREVTSRYELPTATYVIIPCLFKPDMESKFMMRVFTETKVVSAPVDVATTINVKPTQADDVLQLFQMCTGGQSEMDARELLNALNQLYKDGTGTSFGVETARCLLAVQDKSKSGVMTVDAFRQMLKDIKVWMDAFKMFDTDKSNNLDTYELAKIFETIGFRVSRQVIESIVIRYGGKKRRVQLEDFLHCCSKLVLMFGQFSRFSKTGLTGKVELSLEDWLATTIYY